MKSLFLSLILSLLLKDTDSTQYLNYVLSYTEEREKNFDLLGRWKLLPIFSSSQKTTKIMDWKKDQHTSERTKKISFQLFTLGTVSLSFCLFFPVGAFLERCRRDGLNSMNSGHFCLLSISSSLFLCKSSEHVDISILKSLGVSGRLICPSKKPPLEI